MKNKYCPETSQLHGAIGQCKTCDALNRQREDMEKAQKANIEQGMVYLFKKLPDFITPRPRYMSERKRSSLWGHMCMWINEYVESLKDKEPLTVEPECGCHCHNNHEGMDGTNGKANCKCLPNCEHCNPYYNK